MFNRTSNRPFGSKGIEKNNKDTRTKNIILYNLSLYTNFNAKGDHNTFFANYNLKQNYKERYYKSVDCSKSKKSVLWKTEKKFLSSPTSYPGHFDSRIKLPFLKNVSTLE